MTHSFSRFAVSLVAAALVGFAFMPGEASARMGGMGGFHGGMGGGFHGGFRGSPAALHAAPAFRSGFVSPQFRTPLIHRSVIVNRPFVVNRFHRFHRFAFVGAPFFAASVVNAGYDDCLAPRRVWTPYGWRIRWINVCYGYGY